MSESALDVDLSALVGEMPAVPCEHSSHPLLHGDRKATHYISYQCAKCPKHRFGYAVCGYVIAQYWLDIDVICPDCNDHRPANEVWAIVGRV